MAPPGQILILGARSNLSRHLAAAWPQARRMSARDLLDDAPLPVSPDQPLHVVVNSFQPATRLADVSDPVGYVDMSLRSTARLLERLASYDVRKLVYTSSAAVYGDNVECRETDRPRAAGLHAGLKVANEDLVRRVGQARGFSVTLARLFNLYGGDDTFSIVSKIVRAAREGARLTLVNHGHAIRDFVHIDDAVRAYTALLTTPLDVVNVASGVGVSVRTLLDALAVRGVTVPTTSLTRDEIRVSTANVDRLATLVDVDQFRLATDFVTQEVAR